jgi:DNA mismatch repair protein MutS
MKRPTPPRKIMHDDDAPREAAPDAPDTGRVTPMMAQYTEIKGANPGSLLFYRMGDFYELFFEDAEIASRALGIVLTRRGKHLGEDIPMCGVPVERADEYLQRLIALGHRVSVCEQLEDPAEAKKRGAKSVVRRDVIRLVTPGTITEETLLEPGRANLLVALSRLRDGAGGWSYGLAALDISTGAFVVAEADEATLPAEIARLEPREIVMPEAAREDGALGPLWRETRAALTVLPRESFDGASAARRLTDWFGVATLDAFGDFSRSEISAAAAAIDYVARTQRGERPPLSPPARAGSDALMRIDAATRANLELARTLAGERAGSLTASLDRTLTGGGARLLAQRIAGPLIDPAAIARRLDSVTLFVEEPLLRQEARERLKRAPDLPRALSRLSLSRGGPRDLAAIAQGLEAALGLGRLIGFGEASRAEEIGEAAAALARADAGLGERIASALVDEPPLTRRDGGFVREGYSPPLDETRALRDESRRVIAALQARYAEETACRTLRIKHNNVIGYFVEVPQPVGERMLREEGSPFIHRQTMSGAMRFSTVELADLESRIASAGERALALEQEIFEDLARAVVAAGEDIRAVAEAICVIDVAAGLADLAADRGWTRPIVGAGLDFHIEGGRHPVVEAALAASGGSFVPNACDLSAPEANGGGRIALVTGPNMAGKSTYLRQNALIAILAQAGSFVPARQARIGVVDRLFSRVGAADDLARGRSTFMVEMIETAAILNQATARSLVILDEIGRGTATFDGLSIAWACLEHLHAHNRCRALFATHFHELTALTKRLPRLKNLTMRVTEWEHEVVFLHEVAEGAADRSYGIQVAKLAGLPAPVVERAKAILAELEKGEREKPAQRIIDDLPLFSALLAAPPAPAPRADPQAQALREALSAIHPDDLTPREALDALYRLKGIV